MMLYIYGMLLPEAINIYMGVECLERENIWYGYSKEVVVV
jgi:hypothetical protein